MSAEDSTISNSIMHQNNVYGIFAIIKLIFSKQCKKSFTSTMFISLLAQLVLNCMVIFTLYFIVTNVIDFYVNMNGAAWQFAAWTFHSIDDKYNHFLSPDGNMFSTGFLSIQGLAYKIFTKEYIVPMTIMSGIAGFLIIYHMILCNRSDRLITRLDTCGFLYPTGWEIFGSIILISSFITINYFIIGEWGDSSAYAMNGFIIFYMCLLAVIYTIFVLIVTSWTGTSDSLITHFIITYVSCLGGGYALIFISQNVIGFALPFALLFIILFFTVIGGVLEKIIPNPPEDLFIKSNYTLNGKVYNEEGHFIKLDSDGPLTPSQAWSLKEREKSILDKFNKANEKAIKLKAQSDSSYKTYEKKAEGYKKELDAINSELNKSGKN